MKKTIMILTLVSTMMMAADGAALYKKCVACHGANGEKPALGKSKVLTQMSQDEVLNALNGYKDGSYGGMMKALMKGQVANLSDEDISALAQYISQLKK